MKRPALQNKQVVVLRMAFRAQKFSGLSRNGPQVRRLGTDNFKSYGVVGYLQLASFLHHFHLQNVLGRQKNQLVLHV